MLRAAERALTAGVPPPVGAAEKLLLLESYLEATDVATCGRLSVDFAVDALGFSFAAVAVVDRQRAKLEGVAARHIARHRLEDFSAELDDRGHPLVAALSAEEPVQHPRGTQPPLALARTSWVALPLRCRDRDEFLGEGVLIVGPARPIPHDVLWLAGVLGAKLGRLNTTARIAETELGRERSLLYSIIHTVTDPILLTDMEGRLIIANARAESLFTSVEDASEGRRRAVTLNNMLFSAALGSWAVETSGTARRELLLVDPNEGSDLLFELLSSPVRLPTEGNGIVSILRNVTDLGRAMVEIEENYRRLREAEAEVRAERHRLELIIDSVADPILVTDSDGDVLLANTPGERLFSMPTDADVEWQRRVRGNEAHLSSFVSNLLFSGAERLHRAELGFVDPLTSQAVPFEAIAGKIVNHSGEISAVVTILHDQTEAMEKARLYEQLKGASEELERKVQLATGELAQQNELLRRQALELEQASAAKSQFLANISHEFRTPLNAILGYTYMLVRGVSGSLTSSQKKGLMRVDSNARNLLALINDILDLSRIEAGRMPVRVSEFQLGDLLSEVKLELEPLTQRSGLQVTTSIAPKIPALATDRHKVKQIVLNLLSNAIKFTRQGSVSIRATYLRRRKTVEIALTDTGIGISDAEQTKVFDDFHQVDSSPSRTAGGTGLGLSICRRLATILGGRILLRSRLGEGSTFTLQLPRRLRVK